MDQTERAGELIFRAESGGRLFGIMIVQGGVATAMTGAGQLKARLTGEAMSWLVGQNPWPACEVRFRIMTGWADAPTRRFGTDQPPSAATD